MKPFDKFEFHPLIQQYVHVHSSVVAAYLGWRLLKKEEFLAFLKTRGGDDRVGLAAESLKDEGQHITFSFSGSVGPLVADSDDHLRAIAAMSQQLIGHCYEVLRENGLVPRHNIPLAEFFRHVRNGSYHGNRFNLRPGEPKQLAEWRGMRIVPTLHGKRIFRDSRHEQGSSSTSETP